MWPNSAFQILKKITQRAKRQVLNMHILGKSSTSIFTPSSPKANQNSFVSTSTIKIYASLGCLLTVQVKPLNRLDSQKLLLGLHSICLQVI